MKWIPRLLRRQQFEEADRALRETKSRDPEIYELVRDTHIRGARNNFTIRMGEAYATRARQAKEGGQ